MVPNYKIAQSCEFKDQEKEKNMSTKHSLDLVGRESPSKAYSWPLDDMGVRSANTLSSQKPVYNWLPKT